MNNTDEAVVEEVNFAPLSIQCLINNLIAKKHTERSIRLSIQRMIEKGKIKFNSDFLLTKRGKKYKSVKYQRPTWDEYFIELTKSAAKRASCDRGRSGCIITKNNELISTGYVGSPSKMPSCDEVGHKLLKVKNLKTKLIKTNCIRTIHAEANAIIQAAKRGRSIINGTLYCSMVPCLSCAKLIIGVKIKRVVAINKYHDGDEALKLLKLAKIKIDIIHNRTKKYKHQ